MALRLKKNGEYARLPQPRQPRPSMKVKFAKESRTFSAKQRRQIEGHARGKCEGCGDQLGESWHTHHVTPWGMGGRTDILNAEALCAGCHTERHRPAREAPPEDVTSPEAETLAAGEGEAGATRGLPRAAPAPYRDTGTRG